MDNMDKNVRYFFPDIPTLHFSSVPCSLIV
jgi:hypothetical protein